jgi:hypothetical protein
MKRSITFVLVLAALATAAFVLPSRAGAAPANDDFSNATVVGSLPLNESVDVTTASLETGEFACQSDYSSARTVWYSFTATGSELAEARTEAVDFSDAFVDIFQADGPGLEGLRFLGCQQFPWLPPVMVTLQAGATYYVHAGSLWSQSGTMQVHVGLIPPPPNDKFADAIPITSVPYSNTQDNRAATTEPGEPLNGWASARTAWYRFTPTTAGSYYAAAGPDNGANVYAGSSLTDLTLVANYNGAAFHADPGTTYWVQVGNSSFPYWPPPYTLVFDAVPPPTTAFMTSPGDPSAFDTMTFLNDSVDPWYAGWSSQQWTFGDGATSTEWSPQHKYAADGTYSVTLTVTTTDGRTASTTNVVRVETHDVAILSFTTPDKGQTGRLSTIEVGIGNTRFPETVQVDLYKSTPNGWQQVGKLTNAVKVMGKRKLVPFTFSYVFTNDDLTMGKVNFQAVATIQGHRDALPSDNTAISPPTRVNR